jgi:hypothetical protein
LGFILLSGNLFGKSSFPPDENATLLRGRVLADIASLTFGAGVGPQYQTFVFGIEPEHSDKVVPVKVVYAFFKNQGPLRDDFFDHSRVYELNVSRDSSCDERLDKLSYQPSEGPNGEQLAPMKVLQLVYGAPTDLLSGDRVLPCYILHGPKFKVVSQDGDRITRCFVRVPPNLQDAAFTVMYKFETKDAKPIHITKVHNDFLGDDEFTACISRWTVASMREGIAEFTWKPTEGWTLNVSAKSNYAR